MGGGFSLDLRRHRGDQLLALLGRQVPQARERIELQGLAGGVLEAAEVVAASAGEVLLGAVEPPSLQGLRCFSFYELLVYNPNFFRKDEPI